MMVDDILFFLDSTKKDHKQCVVQQVIEKYHSGPLSGHFSRDKLYMMLVKTTGSGKVCSDTINRCSSCPQCAIVNPSGGVNKPPL